MRFSLVFVCVVLFVLSVFADGAKFEEGVRLFKEGEYEKALEAFREVLKERDDAVVHYNIALTLYRLGRYDDAVEEYRKALQMREGYEEAKLGLASALAMAGKVGDAASVLKDVELVKKSKENLTTLAIVAERAGDRASEETLLSILAALLPDDVGVRLRLADLRLSSAKPEDALLVLEGLKERVPDNPTVHLLTSYALRRVGRLREAIDEAEVALALGEEKALRILASLYEEVGLVRIAAEHTLRLAESKGSDRLLLRAAQLYIDSSAHEEALKVLVRVSTKGVEGLLLEASALVELERFDEALKVVDEVLEKEETVQARLLRAEVLLRLERYEDAEKEYRTVLGIEPSNGVALRNLVFVLQRLGREEEASELLRRRSSEEER